MLCFIRDSWLSIFVWEFGVRDEIVFVDVWDVMDFMFWAVAAKANAVNNLGVVCACFLV